MPAIYRLQEDKITDASGTQVALNNSDGLTLNIAGSVQYEFSKHSGVSLLFGTPSGVSDVVTEGLTRKLVVTASYLFRFAK